MNSNTYSNKTDTATPPTTTATTEPATNTETHSINDTFWLHKPLSLFNNFFNIVIQPRQSTIQNLNAATKLSMHIAVILTLWYRNLNYMIIFVAMAMCSVIIYKTYTKSSRKELFKPELSMVLPTPNNPFMNVQPQDYIDNPERHIPKNLSRNASIQHDMEALFNIGLHKGSIDVFKRNNSQRQYYTTANTTIPNKQKELAEWLYGSPPTCKEGNGLQCVGNVNYDLRQSSVFREPLN